MPTEKENDHIGRALGRLAKQFRNKPNLEALITITATQTQGVENAMWSVLDAFNVDDAIGLQLTIVGKIVGEPRDGENDDEIYRLRVRARQRVNRSRGRIEDVYAVFRALLPGAKLVQRPSYPAGFTLTVSGVELDTDAAALAAEFLEAAAADGVGVRLIYQDDPDADIFQFDGGPGFDDGAFADAQ